MFFPPPTPARAGLSSEPGLLSRPSGTFTTLAIRTAAASTRGRTRGRTRADGPCDRRRTERRGDPASDPSPGRIARHTVVVTPTPETGTRPTPSAELRGRAAGEPNDGRNGIRTRRTSIGDITPGPVGPRGRSRSPKRLRCANMHIIGYQSNPSFPPPPPHRFLYRLLSAFVFSPIS